MQIREQLLQIRNQLPPQTSLVAVSKFQSSEKIMEAYQAGQRIFGEDKVQELISKYPVLPAHIQWHFIGHLQTNKVKFIVPFIDLIHSVDSLDLLREINRQAMKCNRNIRILLQIHIAQETSKYGLSYEACEQLIQSEEFRSFQCTIIAGLMGMASFTDNREQIRNEFKQLTAFFAHVKTKYFSSNLSFRELSIGMSNDYLIAIEEGSTMVRIGSDIFGDRK